MIGTGPMVRSGSMGERRGVFLFFLSFFQACTPKGFSARFFFHFTTPVKAGAHFHYPIPLLYCSALGSSGITRSIFALK